MAGELIEVVWQRLEASGHRGALLEEAAAFSQMTADFHPLSKARKLKAQLPDYELYTLCVRAKRGASCADCHMP